MKVTRRAWAPAAWLAVLALLATVLAACGSGDDGGVASSSPTPAATAAISATATPSTPAGWKPIRAKAYSGAVAPGWDFFEISTEDLFKDSAVFEGLRAAGADDSVIENLRQSVAQLPPGSRFGLVYLKNDSQFRTNINLTPCDAGNYTPERWLSLNQMEAQQGGNRLTSVGRAKIQDRQYEVYRMEPGLAAGYSTYNVFPVSPGGCGYAVTLSERASVPSSLDNFIRFLETLRFFESGV